MFLPFLVFLSPVLEAVCLCIFLVYVSFLVILLPYVTILLSCTFVHLLYTLCIMPFGLGAFKGIAIPHNS